MKKAEGSDAFDFIKSENAQSISDEIVIAMAMMNYSVTTPPTTDAVSMSSPQFGDLTTEQKAIVRHITNSYTVHLRYPPFKATQQPQAQQPEEEELGEEY
ncbi:Hypothetical Protein FCC1311_048182 [Hondaea fermentalgiana]|uniref:Uncharacterized protein n=1 Tax=Hondaea fermentalgiana TaxID=2315210 RepID=A0A2R5GC92_9STRA|nr:Hypothetical Protein FCC1311_048182 [Hondaea fermentalgiana]|eukprot:GBG28597.1 Hypothetical Protein FCC1311_048182 [Hondaea fermentalgiana]